MQRKKFDPVLSSIHEIPDEDNTDSQKESEIDELRPVRLTSTPTEAFADHLEQMIDDKVELCSVHFLSNHFSFDQIVANENLIDAKNIAKKRFKDEIDLSKLNSVVHFYELAKYNITTINTTRLLNLHDQTSQIFIQKLIALCEILKLAKHKNFIESLLDLGEKNYQVSKATIIGLCQNQKTEQDYINAVLAFECLSNEKKRRFCKFLKDFDKLRKRNFSVSVICNFCFSIVSEQNMNVRYHLDRRNYENVKRFLRTVIAPLPKPFIEIFVDDDETVGKNLANAEDEINKFSLLLTTRDENVKKVCYAISMVSWEHKDRIALTISQAFDKCLRSEKEQKEFALFESFNEKTVGFDIE